MARSRARLAAVAAILLTVAEAHAVESDSRILTHARVRASNLLTLSAGAGWMRARIPREFPCFEVCRFSGPVALVEAGVSGAQAGVGWGRMSGQLRPDSGFLRDVLLGISVKAVVLRTWRGLEPDDQTLGGIEGTFAVVRGHVTLGVYRAVHPNTVDDTWQFGWGIGWGF